MNKSPIKPDENRIEELLAKIQPVPSKQFHQKMKRAAWRTSEERVVRNFRMKIAFAIVTITSLIALFASPAGRAWAQEMFQFFRKVNFTTIPVSEKEQNLLNAPPKQYELPLVPVLVPTLTPTMESLRECRSPQNIQSYACQIAYAEAQLGLDLRELPKTPENWIFKEIRFDTVSKNASIVYTHYSEHGSTFVLRQGIGSFHSHYWDIVPADKVEAVKIGEFTGEYVSGVFTYTTGDTAWRWEGPDSIQRLAWSDGERWYYMEVLPPGPKSISRDEFVEFAASLVNQPSEIADPLNPDSLSSVVDAEKYSGLDLKAPTILPLGYEFSYARYFSANHEVHLHYDEGAEDLVIYEWRGEPEDFDALAKIFKNHEIVQVGDRPAFYGVPDAVAQYESTYLMLAWRDAGMNYRIYFYFNSLWGGGLLDRSKMVAIAESMSDINAVKVYASKPYEYVSIYEQALGFDVKEFSGTPAGWLFSDVSAYMLPNCINISYSAEVENGWLYIQQCKTNMANDYEQHIPRNAIEQIKIGKRKGEYILGKLETDINGQTTWDSGAPYRTLRWQENGFWIEIMMSGDSVALYDKDALVSLAESLR